MEQLQRPYLRYSIAELLLLFETQKGDEEILVQLQKELTHRARPTAMALATEVEQAIASLKGRKQSDPFELTPAASPTRFHPAEARQKADLEDDEPKDEGEIEDEQSQLAEGREIPESLLSHPLVPIRACGSLRDVPETYIAPLEETLKLNLQPEMELRFRYVVALRAHVEELRRSGGYQVIIAVRDGKRTSFEGGKSGYQFSFDDDAGNIFDGAGVLIATGRRTFPGRVVAVMLSNKTILVETDEDLGEEIPAAELRIDNSAMLGQVGRSDNVRS